MPVIRIDEEVYAWLKQQAQPFDDTPNSVLRRVAGLRDAHEGNLVKERRSSMPTKTRRAGIRSPRSIRGTQLAIEEGLSVRRAYYHHEGTWFQVPMDFPVALFDTQGFVIFETETAFRNTNGVEVGEKTNIRSGIASLPGYKQRSVRAEFS